MAVAIVLVVAAPGAAPASANIPTKAASHGVRAATAHTQREVFGFALASSLADPSVGYPSWNFDLLSTVAFFGLHIGTAGQFAGDAGWDTWNSSALTSLVSIAHQHGTKVVLTVVLQDFSPNTPNMCAGLQNADATVAETVQQVKAKGVDGVNIDYEGLDGSCGMNDPNWAQHSFTVFAQKMRSGLGSSYYLSVDTYASSAGDGYGFFDVPNLAASVDSFFVMAYDLEYSNYSRLPSSCPQFCLGPTGPLSGYYYNDSTIASQYVSAVGAGKVILGVPYYGRKACVGAVVANAIPTSGVIADSYLDASTEASDPSVGGGTYATHRDAYSSGSERWDTWYSTSLGCTRELYWDDSTSLGKKYDLVNADNLRGAGIWNLNYGGGAPELWSGLAAHFGGCTAVSVSAAPASPAIARTQVTVTGTASGCPNPRYQFLAQWAGTSTWVVQKAYSTSNTWTWNSSGAPPGVARFGVWARDASSTADYDANASAPFTVYSPCSSASVTISPASPVARGSGAVVTVTASAAGCPNPQFQFVALWAGTNAWMLQSVFSGSNTWTWNSTGAPAGTERFGVWVRDAASPAAYDTLASAPYTLYSPCSSPTVSSSPVSPVAHGAAITVTASAGACPNPQFQFVALWAGTNTWIVQRTFSSGNTWTWNSTGAPAGTERFGVWVRDAASTAAYDSLASAPSTIFAPCSSASESFSPVSPIAHGAGATVSVTAKAVGCADPLYEFWMRPASSSTWQLVQAYSTSATYRWNSHGAPAGTVYFGVWARDAASPASADLYYSLPYALT